MPISRFPRAACVKAIGERAGSGAHFIEAQRLASALLGDAIATNMFMVGYAWQQGGIPLPKEAILEAIRLNGVEEAMNVAAFEWGRRAAHDPEAVAEMAGLAAPVTADDSLAALVERRASFLADYQGRRLRARAIGSGSRRSPRPRQRSRRATRLPAPSRSRSSI